MYTTHILTQICDNVLSYVLYHCMHAGGCSIRRQHLEWEDTVMLEEARKTFQEAS
jgi:hypothetical protein